MPTFAPIALDEDGGGTTCFFSASAPINEEYENEDEDEDDEGALEGGSAFLDAAADAADAADADADF